MHLLIDGKSQSLNGLILKLNQHWQEQPIEGSELNTTIVNRIQSGIVQALHQSLVNESDIVSNNPKLLFAKNQNLNPSNEKTNDF